MVAIKVLILKYPILHKVSARVGVSAHITEIVNSEAWIELETFEKMRHKRFGK